MSPAPALAPTVRFLESHRADQRLNRRYPIALEIEYKLLRKGRVERLGLGRTLNVSSGGVLFEANEPLPAGSSVELLMQWPFMLEGVCPLKLVILGSVVRSDGKGVAVRTKHHEFRTAGARSSKPSNKVRSLMR
jgi:PilZ domain